MPNHCNNTTTIIGPESEITKLYEIFTVQDETQMESVLTRLFPVPKELMVPSTHIPGDNYNHVMSFVERGMLSLEEANERIERDKELYDVYQKNIENFGYKDWYDWSIANYGTKWGDYNHRNEIEIVDYNGEKGIVLIYDTAWGPFEENFWIRVSKSFPNCSFETSFYETGMNFLGVAYAKNGNSYFEQDQIDFDYEKYDQDEDFIEMMDDLDERISDQIDEIASAIYNLVSE